MTLLKVQYNKMSNVEGQYVCQKASAVLGKISASHPHKLSGIDQSNTCSPSSFIRKQEPSLINQNIFQTVILFPLFICAPLLVCFSTPGNGTKIVLRKCNVKIENPNSCNYTIQYRLSSFTAIANKDEFKCSLCEEDGCNSAHSYHNWTPLFILIATIPVMKQFV